jgi:hypothetical protein
MPPQKRRVLAKHFKNKEKNGVSDTKCESTCIKTKENQSKINQYRPRRYRRQPSYRPAVVSKNQTAETVLLFNLYSFPPGHLRYCCAKCIYGTVSVVLVKDGKEKQSAVVKDGKNNKK